MVPSQHSDLKAVVFSRNCGATTSDNVQVSIEKTDDAPTGKGNVVIYDQVAYSALAKPRWLDDKRLVITIPVGARVYFENRRVRSIDILFRNSST